MNPVRYTCGDAQTIPIPAAAHTGHAPPLLGASADALAFSSTPLPYGSHVAIVERTGRRLEIWPKAELAGFYRLSPDGTRLAQTRTDEQVADPDIWVNDLVRGSRVRITTTRDVDVLPTWSPDGQRLAFRSGPLQHVNVTVSASDGTGAATTLTCPTPYCEPTDWSPDGRFLIVNSGTGDVWTLPLDSTEPPAKLLGEPFLERDARISHDGRWITYVSEESGRPEVSVRSLIGPLRRYVVSNGGGDQPVWRRDGSELFYVSSDGQLYGVAVRPMAEGTLAFSLPAKLNVPRFGERHWGTVYDVSTDGRRVFFPYPGTAKSPTTFSVILDWRALVNEPTDSAR